MSTNFDGYKADNLGISHGNKIRPSNLTIHFAVLPITFGKVDERSLRWRNSADSVMRSIMDPLCMISPEGGPGGSDVPGTGW